MTLSLVCDNFPLIEDDVQDIDCTKHNYAVLSLSCMIAVERKMFHLDGSKLNYPMFNYFINKGFPILLVCFMGRPRN
jgi:hypothetical protein